MIGKGAGALPRAALLVVLAGASWSQPEGPRLTRPSLPAAPVYSKDGTVTVHAPAAKASYRAPVLVFVDRTRDELGRATRLKLGSQACPLEVAIGGKSDGDTRVLSVRVRDAATGSLRERIELPDPEAADLALFRRAICAALLRAWMVEAGGTADTMRELPAWLIDGVVRYMSRETRQADADRALLLWSRACLPVASELCEEQSLAATREPAVAAVLAGWFLERRQAGSPLEALMRGSATGEAWRTERVSRLLAGTEDPVAFDEALDLWMLAEGRQVVKPGVTTAGVVRRFRSSLLLYPADYGKTMDQRKAWLTFQEAASCADDPVVRFSARRQAVLVKMAALGRDGMLLAVSEAYANFLEALARGSKQGELSRLLMEAENGRLEVERKTARGGVLQRSEGG